MRQRKVFTKFDIERIRSIINGRLDGLQLEAGSVNRLKADLEHAKPVDPRNVRPNIVTMNSRFSLKNIGNGRKEVYTLVFPKDQNTGENKISVFSQIGCEVLGASIGTVIRQRVAGSEQYLLLEEIIFQPEAEGQFHL